jgi:hypothetical protein
VGELEEIWGMSQEWKRVVEEWGEEWEESELVVAGTEAWVNGDGKISHGLWLYCAVVEGVVDMRRVADEQRRMERGDEESGAVSGICARVVGLCGWRRGMVGAGGVAGGGVAEMAARAVIGEMSVLDSCECGWRELIN